MAKRRRDEAHSSEIDLTDAKGRSTTDRASAAGWIALPVGRAEGGPTIAELVEAVKAAGGMVGGDALYDPRYEAEMRRFLIRALEMEGIPVPEGGGTP
jgi:hypothetical protein